MVKPLDTINGNQMVRNVQLSGSNLAQGSGIPVQGATKIEVETIANAVSVAAAGGRTADLTATYKGESLTFYAVTIDKQPWSFYCLSPYGVGFGTFSYPTGSIVKAFTNPAQPKTFIQQILHEDKATTWRDAESIAVSFAGQGCKVENNHATDIATVTVKVIRVWRG